MERSNYVVADKGCLLFGEKKTDDVADRSEIVGGGCSGLCTLLLSLSSRKESC